MSHTSRHRSVGGCLFLAAVLALAIPASQAITQEITGPWEMTMNFGGRPSYATLTISRNADGSLAGKWGSSELTNVRFDGQRLTFTRVLRMGDQEFTMNYMGTLKDGKITGLMSSDRGEFEVDGARVKPKSPALGQWAMQYKIGDRDATGTLSISQKSDGALEGTWTSQRGESEISNVAFQDGTLRFDRTIRFNDREFKLAFEGTVQGDKVTGAFTSDRGETPVTGERMGKAVIGKWELTTTSDRGTRTRMLTIYPDMTGRYEWFGGAEMAIQDLKLEGNAVTFAIATSFGDQTFRMDFKGTLAGKTLKGQITSNRGTTEVDGRKMESASPVVGTWEFTRETQRGTRTSTLTIKPDMTGSFTMRDNELPVTDLTVNGNQISFKIAVTFNNNEMTLDFKGIVEGQILQGEFSTPRGTREAVGKKIK